jgi:transcriptional regulator with XRE-family HTH domain
MEDYTLANWLRDRLREHSLSQRRLSKATHIATGTISAILHGHVPGPEMVTELANYFGAEPSTVMEIAGIVELSDMPNDLPVEVRGLLRRLYRLDARERNAILKQLSQLLDLLEDRPGTPSTGA